MLVVGQQGASKGVAAIRNYSWPPSSFCPRKESSLVRLDGCIQVARGLPCHLIIPPPPAPQVGLNACKLHKKGLNAFRSSFYEHLVRTWRAGDNIEALLGCIPMPQVHDRMQTLSSLSPVTVSLPPAAAKRPFLNLCLAMQGRLTQLPRLQPHSLLLSMLLTTPQTHALDADI